MTGLVISLAITVWIAVMLLKKYYAPAILLLGGLALIVISTIMGTGELIAPKNATGLSAGCFLPGLLVLDYRS